MLAFAVCVGGAGEDLQTEGLVSTGGGEDPEGSIILFLLFVFFIVLSEGWKSDPGKECEQEEACGGSGHEIWELL